MFGLFFGKMSKITAATTSLMLILFISLWTAGCQNEGKYLSKATAVTSLKINSATQPVRNDETSVNISLVGDIMIHSDQLAYAYDYKSRSYSFAGIFDEIKNSLSSADLTIGNLETTLAGKNQTYSGFPKFNSPEQILTALKDAGFDVLTTANNHSMDRNQYGVLKTIENLDAVNLKHTGTFSSVQERLDTLILDIKGIKIALLAYTYGTNGLPVPPEKKYLVNLFNLNTLRQDILKARQDGADIVMVCPHFGIEYQQIPDKAKLRLVEELFVAGADIVAGSHPHVLQPMGRRDLPKKSRGLFVAYSLGNFIASQRIKGTDSGVILNLQLVKNTDTGQVTLGKTSYIPTWIHKYRENGRTKFRVVEVEKAIRNYEQKMDNKITAGDYLRLKQVWQDTNSLLTSEGLEVCHV